MADGDAHAYADDQASTCIVSTVSTVIFHLSSAIVVAAVAQVQTTLRRRILHAFLGRGNPHRTTRSTSASIGDMAKRRLRHAAGEACVCARPTDVLRTYARAIESRYAVKLQETAVMPG